MFLIVFVDIEAGNLSLKHSICNVGLIITDDNFKVQETHNIYINPNSDFNIIKELDIGINEKFLLDKPMFSEYYEFFAKYLNSDNLVIGHNMLSDTAMFLAACKRYKLPMFEYKFLCSQMLYSVCHRLDKEFSLEKLADIYQIDYVPHRAINDAYATKEVIKKLLEEKKCNLKELLKTYKIEYGISSIEKIANSRSLIRDGLLLNKKINRSIKRHKNIGPLSKVFKEISQFHPSYKLKASDKLFLGKTFQFTRLVSSFESSVITGLIQFVINLGGKVTVKRKKANIYIYSEDLETKEIEKIKEESNIQVISLTQFSNFIKDYSLNLATEISDYLKF